MGEVVITGIKSTIAVEFIKLLNDETVHGIRVEDMYKHTQADKYLFCQGFLVPKTSDEQTKLEKEKSHYINYDSIVLSISNIINCNPKARICVIGSESGYRRSYDDSYAKYKKWLHKYVEDKKLLTPYQQLVGISPTIIEDSKMTQDRTDIDNLNRRRSEHPMKRFLKAKEVASMAYTLLYEQPYVNRTIIRMHGGM